VTLKKRLNKKLLILGKKENLFNRIYFILSYQIKIVFELLAYFCPINSIRVFLHRARGLQVGNDVYLGRELLIDRVYTNKIIIGNHTTIGDRTIITAHASTPVNLYFKRYFEVVKDVKIGNHVWIQPQVIITPGVQIGDESIIVTGSIVTKDIPPKSFVTPNSLEIKPMPNFSK
jgi:acetyltransferase-like isoleucine patch superfamily enzyme